MDSRGWALQPAHRSEWTPTLREHRPSDQQDNDYEVGNFCVYVVYASFTTSASTSR
ncbi:hypothetical protein ACGFWI_37280 [Streptomyces sp. NPDC048434]|uniref:hypothetical protein n=1 Tax=Streptomyces sp. NPDC048434 TaxID=3365549 RepID=UPI0037177C1F